MWYTSRILGLPDITYFWAILLTGTHKETLIHSLYKLLEEEDNINKNHFHLGNHDHNSFAHSNTNGDFSLMLMNILPRNFNQTNFNFYVR